ncbi:MAG: hypothetical protein Q9168_005531 [Polycauliona sp. 1 TL-2023]
MARTSKVGTPKAATPSAPARSTTTNDAAIHGDSDTTMADPDHHDVDDAGAAHDDDSSDTLDDDSDAGLELLSKGMKAFVTVIQNLRDLGVEELVLPLPKIVVLGDQSTGKSSLIEGISGIKVPRSSGTCTRCPLEVNLTPSEPGSQWKATMYLQKRYLFEGSQSSTPFSKFSGAQSERATKKKPLGPWVLQTLPENFLFFKTSKKSDIPEALHLAQLATLNPGTDHARYLPGADAKNNTSNYRQVKFSPNVVRLDISAPDVPNLSFYDLPGVINQAEVAEEEHLVTLVRNLVRSYIKDDSCINLLALPMTDDAANSTASKLVQEANAQDRTLGVLTKPDRVQVGESMEQWHAILDGSKFRIGHGYYVVKNNPNPEVSNVVARQEEARFFNQEPWVRSLSKHDDRFGTFKLSAKLSKLLNAQIKSRQVSSKSHLTVRSKTAEIIERLRELPEPPQGNLSLKIFEKILAFTQDLRCHLEGGSEAYPFQKEFHHAALRFRNTIAFSYPRLNLADARLNLKSSSQMAYRLSVTPIPGNRSFDAIPIDSDGECVEYTKTPSPSKRKQPSSNTSQSTPTKRGRLDNIPQFVPAQDATSSFDGPNTSVDRTAPFAKRFTLTEIRAILQDAHIGLPNQVDPKATKRMIKDSLQKWEEPLEELLGFANDTCLALILDRASCTFGLWQGTQCFDRVLEICKSFFQDKFQVQVTSAKRILDIERNTAMTLHEDSMRSATENAMVALSIACRNERAKAFLAKQDPEWEVKLTTHQAKLDKMSKVTEDQLGPNPFVQELRAMADVRGYYECAYSRFVDVIYQGIQTELFAACRNDLGEALKQGIGLEEKDAEQRCATLLAVDPENERIRAELVKQKSNLEKASEWLESQ